MATPTPFRMLNQTYKIMKYKEQALKKLEKIDHKVAALESAISRSEDMSVIAGAFRDMREAVSSLRDTISIENDEMNY